MDSIFIISNHIAGYVITLCDNISNIFKKDTSIILRIPSTIIKISSRNPIQQILALNTYFQARRAASLHYKCWDT